MPKPKLEVRLSLAEGVRVLTELVNNPEMQRKLAELPSDDRMRPIPRCDACGRVLPSNGER